MLIDAFEINIGTLGKTVHRLQPDLIPLRRRTEGRGLRHMAVREDVLGADRELRQHKVLAVELIVIEAHGSVL